MIFLGACNFGHNSTNHDIGGSFIKLGGLCTSFGCGYWSYKVGSAIFVLHNSGVNDLYKTIRQLHKDHPHKDIFIIMDDYIFPIGEWKVSSFRDIGHNLCKNIKLYIYDLIPKINMIRIGIREYEGQPLGSLIFKTIDKINIELIKKLYKNVLISYQKSGDNISLFKMILQASVV